jgi:hypothetical protein
MRSCGPRAPFPGLLRRAGGAAYLRAGNPVHACHACGAGSVPAITDNASTTMPSLAGAVSSELISPGAAI